MYYYRNYKSLEAFRFFLSGWVQTVYHIKPSSSVFVCGADVKLLYRVNDDPHHPWVASAKEGKIIAGHCDCMDGLGETCSHVGAVLFKIEAAVHLGYTASACTDVPCKWNQCFVKDVQPVRIKDIKFYDESATAKIRKTDNRREFALATVDEQNAFLKALAETGENVVGLSGFTQYTELFILKRRIPTKKQLPRPLRCLYDVNLANLPDADLTQCRQEVASSVENQCTGESLP